MVTRIVIFLLLFTPFFGVTQLVTNTSMTPTQLVQNIFQGSGVTISNINFTGNSGAIGYFDGSNTNLGISEGIVMTTGTVSNTSEGPHGPNDQPDAGVDNGAGGYGPLTNLAGAQTFNASVLEFDFVTCSDQVSFNYVFGSEEFLEYVDTDFNDAFALYISGPGFAGLQNIALLPNGTPVAINNVHTAGTNVNGVNFGPVNSQYYVNNNNGATIQYDGFTTKLTANATVQCEQTYHLIIAIADAGDGIYDSGIFLEANSFNGGNSLNLDHTLSANVFNDDNIIAEGCVTTTLTLERSSCNNSQATTVPISVSGTATEGVDFSNIPASITFPAGVTSVNLDFDCFQDGVLEGPETIILEFTFTDNCGNVSTSELELTIQEPDPTSLEVTGDEIDCPGEEVELIATPVGGIPPYTFQWSTGETTQSIFVSPTVTTTYSVTMNDDCLNQPITVDYEVVVPEFDPLVLDETPDIVEICPYIPATISANPTGGSGGYTYQWSSNFDSDLGNTNSISVTPSTTTTYTVVVTDQCGLSTTETVVYTITSPPLVLEMSPNVEICPGDTVEIGVTPSGGFGQYFYLWPHSGETTSSVFVNPYETTQYEVIVSDECQTFTVEGNTTVIVVKPTANFTISSETVFNNLPIQFENLSQDAITYVWDFGDGQGSTLVHPSNTYLDPGIYNIELVAIDEMGCKDTIMRPLEVEEEWYVYIPNTFTPDGNRLNSVFEVSTYGVQRLSMQIFNRWGQLIFESNDLNFGWDGTYNGVLVQDGTYTYKVEFVTNSRRKKTQVGHVNVLK